MGTPLTVEETEDQRASEALRQQNAQLRLLSQLAAGLMHGGDPIHVIQELFNPVAGEFGIDISLHYTVDDAGETLHLAASLGVPAEEAQQNARLDYGQVICGMVAQTRRSLHLSHIQQSDDPKLQFARQHGLRACACYPLTVGDHFLGVLFFGTFQQDAFAQSELDFLQTISQYLALAEERWRTEQSYRHEHELLQRLFDRILVNEQRLRSAVEAADLGTWELDLERGLINCDERTQAIVGVALDGPVPYEQVLAFVHPEDHELSIQTGEAATAPASAGSYNAEKRVLRPGGETRWVVVNGKTIFEDKGAATRIIGTVLDITERKQAEKALAEERNLLRTILEAIPDYVYAKDMNSRFILANSTVARAAGVSSLDEVIGKTDFDLFPEELAAAYFADEQVLMRSGQPLLNKDESVTETDGSKRWILTTKVPLHDSEGKIVGLAGVGRDITERKRVEEALLELNATLEEKVRTRTRTLEDTNAELRRALRNEQRARDLFSTLFHTNPVPLAITRVSDGCFIDVNEAQLRYFGLEREEMIGRTSLELNLFHDPTDRTAMIAELREKGRVRNREISLRHPSGRIIETLFFAEPLELDGESYLIGSLVDISERVRAEQLIRRLASELSLAEERERQRIAQMLHDEVQQMLVALKVTLFLANERADGETSESLQQASEYVQELLRTTRALTAELSAPTLKGDRLVEALGWLRGYMDERYGLQVHLTFEAEADKANVPSGGYAQDKRAMIIRLVRELLFNVFKHAGVSEAHVLVREEGEDLLIRVEDEGKGFDPASLAATSNEESSFGLFSVRERLALIGGRFELDSAPGAGTRATMIIPKALLD